VPVVGSIRIVVAIFSYDGGLYFGVTGDYDGAPDIDALTAGIEQGMRDLLGLPSPPKRARRPRKKPAVASVGNGGKPAAAHIRNGGKLAAAAPTRNGGKPADAGVRSSAARP
jgi:hypothetical protein